MIVNLLVYPWEARPGSDTIDGELVVSVAGEDPVTIHTAKGSQAYPRWAIITVGRKNPQPLGLEHQDQVLLQNATPTADDLET